MSSNSGMSDLAVLEKPYMWKLGDEITVKFLNGTDTDRNEVKEHAVKWTGSDAANLTLTFVSDNEDALVRVKFGTGELSAKVGTECKEITDQSKPTVDLTYPPNVPASARAYYILHEFGHVLGFDHKHQSPNANIPWIRDNVYAYYAARGRTRKWVEDEVFRVLQVMDVFSSPCDSKSIMHYAIKADWVTDLDYAVPYASLVLSDQDKQFAAQCYPVTPRPSVAARLPRPANYAVSICPPPFISDAVASPDSMQLSSNDTTLEMGQWDTHNTNFNPPDGEQTFYANKPFANPHTSPYHMALGYNSLDIGRGSYGYRIRAQTRVRDEYDDWGFSMWSLTWDNSKMYNTGVNWFKVPKDHPFIQCGGVAFQIDPTVQRNSCPIAFDRQFGGPPTVLLMIRGFDNDDNWRLSVYPDGITTTGFTANVETWGSSNLYAAYLQFIAFPSNISWIASGEIWGVYGQGFSRSISFKHSFNKPPKIFTAISKFDVDSNHNFRCKFNITNITTTGFDYYIEQWADTNLWEIRGKYFAIEI
ncbi:hypothetical protein C8J56DRAFT_79004 [Mycena floridula]|nr:hypothetical protein C8J56DRAFT_79004 [Mycena floridula]